MILSGLRRSLRSRIVTLLPGATRRRGIERAVSSAGDGLVGPSKARQSFAQDAEDLVLSSMYTDLTPGFYVDIGAHHPVSRSNSHYYYQLGWRGINIDPAEGMIELFGSARPRDVNLQIAIDLQEGYQTLYQFDDPLLSGLDYRVAKQREHEGRHRIVGEIAVRTCPLRRVLDEHLPRGQTIDFMSVDVEGTELRVLMSNDWEVYRPGVILVEIIGPIDLGELISSPVIEYLSSVGYKPFARTRLTTFLADNARLRQTPFGPVVDRSVHASIAHGKACHDE